MHFNKAGSQKEMSVEGTLHLTSHVYKNRHRSKDPRKTDPTKIIDERRTLEKGVMPLCLKPSTPLARILGGRGLSRGFSRPLGRLIEQLTEHISDLIKSCIELVLERRLALFDGGHLFAELLKS